MTLKMTVWYTAGHAEEERTWGGRESSVRYAQRCIEREREKERETEDIQIQPKTLLRISPQYSPVAYAYNN